MSRSWWSYIRLEFVSRIQILVFFYELHRYYLHVMRNIIPKYADNTAVCCWYYDMPRLCCISPNWAVCRLAGDQRSPHFDISLSSSLCYIIQLYVLLEKIIGGKSNRCSIKRMSYEKRVHLCTVCLIVHNIYFMRVCVIVFCTAVMPLWVCLVRFMTVRSVRQTFLLT